MSKLGVIPNEIQIKGESFIRKPFMIEATYKVTSLKIGYNENYSRDISDMIEVTIKELRSKVDVLREIKEHYPEISYSLEVVPEISVRSVLEKPILTPTKEVMKFLVDIDAEFDIDYYIDEDVW